MDESIFWCCDFVPCLCSCATFQYDSTIFICNIIWKCIWSNYGNLSLPSSLLSFDCGRRKHTCEWAGWQAMAWLLTGDLFFATAIIELHIPLFTHLFTSGLPFGASIWGHPSSGAVGCPAICFQRGMMLYSTWCKLPLNWYANNSLSILSSSRRRGHSKFEAISGFQLICPELWCLS